MRRPPALLLFDVDGTLLLTAGAGMRAMRRAAAKLFGDTFTFDGVVFGGNLDPLIFAEAAALSRLDRHDDHHNRFRDAYLQELQDELAEPDAQITVMPGVPELLASLRPRSGPGGDVVLGVLTGNYSLAAPIKLAAAGIDPAWFSVTAFGDEAPTRAGLTELAMRKYAREIGHAPPPERVIVIGDTPRDIDCAKAHGCVAFAVATGRHEACELWEAGADRVVDDLSDPMPLLALIDG